MRCFRPAPGEWQRVTSEASSWNRSVRLSGVPSPAAPSRRRLGHPGGGMEYGETPREAACREVLEETGLTVQDTTRSTLSVAPNLRSRTQRPSITYFVMLCGHTLESGEVSPQLDEVPESGWSTQDQNGHHRVPARHADPVIGRGLVGGGLARRWTAAGHDVTALGRAGGDGADAVVVAIPGDAIEAGLTRVTGLDGQEIEEAVCPETVLRQLVERVHPKIRGSSRQSASRPSAESQARRGQRFLWSPLLRVRVGTPSFSPTR